MPVDVLHREDVDLRRRGSLFFSSSSRLRMPMSTVWSARTFGRSLADARELGRLGAEQRRERHAVHVAARRRRRRVHVAVRVDPEQADLAAACARRNRPTRRPIRPPASGRRRARSARRLPRATGRPADRASGRRARSRGCIASSGRARPCVSGIGVARSPLSTTGTAHRRRAARQGRRSARPTAPCRRPGGRRRGRAARRARERCGRVEPVTALPDVTAEERARERGQVRHPDRLVADDGAERAELGQHLFAQEVVAGDDAHGQPAEPGIAPQLSQELESAHPRHPDIQNHRVRRLGGRRREPVLGRSGPADLVTRRAPASAPASG